MTSPELPTQHPTLLSLDLDGTSIRSGLERDENDNITTEGLVVGGQRSALCGYLTTVIQPTIETPFELPDEDAHREAILRAVSKGDTRQTLEATAQDLFTERPDVLAEIDTDAVYDLIELHQDSLAGKLKVYPGTLELFEKADQHGTPVLITTSGTTRQVGRNVAHALDNHPDTEGQFNDIVEQLRSNLSPEEVLSNLRRRMQSYFGTKALYLTFMTASDDEARKPEYAFMKAGLEKLRSENPGLKGLGNVALLNNGVHLGDQVDDVHFANNAGIRAGAVTNPGGFHSEEKLREAGAHFVGTLESNVNYFFEGS